MSVQRAQAAPSFPQLSGPVVDEYGLLSEKSKLRLENLLLQYEEDIGNQVVVVVVKSLQGYSIDDYGNRLGRHWAIGQKDKNNGALLIVAPNERRVRIEVGYGLEGSITDAVSHHIIHTKILPHFKNDDYEKGIFAGVHAILLVAEGSYEPDTSPRSVQGAKRSDSLVGLLIGVIVLGHLLQAALGSRLLAGAVTGGVGFMLGWWILGSLVLGLVAAIVILVFLFLFGGGSGGGPFRGGGYSGGGGYGGGGSYSGGGGSFGGGGASGSW